MPHWLRHSPQTGRKNSKFFWQWWWSRVTLKMVERRRFLWLKANVFKAQNKHRKSPSLRPKGTVGKQTYAVGFHESTSLPQWKKKRFPRSESILGPSRYEPDVFPVAPLRHCRTSLFFWLRLWLRFCGRKALRLHHLHLDEVGFDVWWPTFRVFAP